MSGRLRTRLRTTTSLTSGGGGGGPTANLDLNFITGSYQMSGGNYAFQDLIRFSRTTAGTFVGSDGLIQNSPISKNLLLWTEEQDNASWVKNATTVSADALTAPNGTLTARKIVANNAAAFSTTYIRQNISKAASALTYTSSVYAKAGEFNRVRIFARDNSAGANSASVTVSLVDGSITTAANAIGTFTGASAAVTSVGSGWYRVALTFTTGTETTIWGQTIFVEDSVATAGDGASGIYIWGSQLELASSATSYTRNADGLYPPRFDYDPITLENKGLLIEEQRTNLLTYSQQFNDASWTKTNLTVTADATTAPDGASTADKLIGTSTANIHETVKPLTGLSASTAYTISVYLKAAERTWAYVNFLYPTVSDYRTFFDLANGTIGTNPAGSTATITPVGNGWYRCTVTRTTAAGQTNVSVVVAGTTGNNTTIYSGNGTSGIFAWGAQFEAGAFATSYIPTVASTVTRAADIALVTGGAFTPWYNGAEGSLLLEGSVQFGSTRYFFTGVGAQRMGYGISGGSVGIYDGTNAALSVSGVPSGQTFKLATTYSDLAGLAGSLNGSAVFANSAYTGSFATMTSVGLFNVAAGNAPATGHIRSIGYYNTRLTDAQLQALTT